MNPHSYSQLKVFEVEFAVFVPFDVKDSFEDSLYKYEVKGAKGEGFVHFRRDYSPISQHFPVSIAEGAEIDVDRYGQLSRSVVRVEIPKTTLEKLGVTEQNWSSPAHESKFLVYALELMNKFSRLYAEVTGDFWVSIPTKNEILCHTTRPIFNLGAGGCSTRMLPVPTNFSGGKGHFITQEQDSSLRQKLIGSQSDTVAELILSAKDFASRELFKLAVVQCAIAFEYYVYNELLQFPSKTKKKKFMDHHTKNSECGCHVGINAFCKSGIREYLEFDFSETDEFIGVTKNVTSVRNKIVHGESVDVSYDQTQEAVSVTIAAISLLRAVASEVGK